MIDSLAGNQIREGFGRQVVQWRECFVANEGFVRSSGEMMSSRHVYSGIQYGNLFPLPCDSEMPRRSFRTGPLRPVRRF